MSQPKYNNKYISRELFDFYRMTKQPYEGFVIGLGYAFTQKGAIMTSFSTNYNPSNPFCQGTGFFDMCTTQLLDTSPEAVVRSLNLKTEDILSFLVQPRLDGSLLVNMGNDKFLSVPSDNTKVQFIINDDGSTLKYKFEVSNIKTNEYHLVQGSLRDMPYTFGQNNLWDILTSENLKKASFITGSVSLGYSAWENILFSRNSELYIPRAGENKGIPTSVWKRTKSGDFALRNGKKVPVSANAASKIRLVKAVRTGGVVLNAVGVIITMYTIREEGFTLKNSADLIFGAIGFIPGWGWAVSGVYFGLDALGVFDQPVARVIERLERANPFEAVRDNTYVAPHPQLLEIGKSRDSISKTFDKFEKY